MGSLDALVIAGYLLLVVGVGFYYSRREKTTTDYFLAGRSIGWIAIGASLFATNISSEHFIGLAGAGAAAGLAPGNFEWMAIPALFALGWFFAPFYLRSSVFTMPEFLERRFDARSRWYLTSISLVAYILTKVSVTLYAGAILLEKILGWDVVTSSIALVVATGVYTVAGGLTAVIYTEVVQTVILLGGAILLTVLGMQHVGWWAGLRAKLPPEYFSMLRPASDPNFPWTGVFIGVPILGVWYWCTDQFIVQRVLSAKNLAHARAGTILAGFLKILPVFVLVLPGLIAAAAYGSRGDDAYPTLVSSLLPDGARGIVVASLLAALMSSLAACFNSSATLFTMDVWKKVRPASSERALVMAGRATTGVIVVLALAWIPFIRLLKPQIFLYLQSVQAYIAPPIAACFFFGILSTRLNGSGAIASLLTGCVLGAARFVLELLGGAAWGGFVGWYAGMNFLHFAILLFVICSAVLAGVSRFGPAPRIESIADVTVATLRPAPAETRLARVPLLIASALLALLVTILWYVFR